jgi:tetratricopeptide (TPR) repeat protein
LFKQHKNKQWWNTFTSANRLYINKRGLIEMQKYLLKSIYVSLIFLIVYAPLLSQNPPVEYFDQEYAVKDNPAYSSSNAIQLYKEGNRSLSMGKYDNAILFFSKAIANRPRFVDAYFARAMAHERLKNYDHAIADCDTVIILDGQNSEAYFKRAILKYELRDFAGAIVDLNHLLNMETLYTNSVFFRGVKSNESGEARFDGVISMYSQKADIYNQRGLAKKALGDREGALSDLDEAIAINDSDPVLYVNRGAIKKVLGDRDGATRDFRKALALDPGNELALYNLTTGMTGNTKIAEIVSSYDQILDMNPEMTSAYVNRGTARYEMGDYTGAHEDFSKAITLNPKESESYLNRGLAREKLKNYKGALSDYATALKLSGDDHRVYKYRGNAYFQMRDFKNAVEQYTISIGLYPYDAGSFYNRGLARYYLTRDTEAACADLLKAREMGIGQAQAAIDKYCK